MTHRQKDLKKLAVLEAELASRLGSELPKVAAGRNTLFFTTHDFNPYGLPDHMLPERSAALADLASDCITLSESLGAPEAAPVATAFRRCLQRASNVSDHHRLGPARLAEQLLAELESLRRNL